MRRCDNRRVQGSLAKDLRPVVVGMCLVSALLANELAASLPVSFGRMATDGTFTGRVVSGHELDCHARQFGLIGQLPLQVVERPRMQVSPMLSTSLHPRTNTPEVFKGYPSLRAFGIGNYFFTDAVVGIRREAGLFAPTLLQQSLGGLGSLSLESAADAEVTTPQTADFSASKEFAVARCGQNDKTEINADVIRDRRHYGFRNCYRDEQIELAVSQDKIGLAAWQSKQFPLPVSADKRNLLASADRPDRNGIFLGLPGQNTGIIGNAPERSELPLNIMVNLIGVRNLSNTADNHLRREQREIMPCGMVNGFMLIILAEDFGLERNRGKTITDTVGLFNGLLQGNRLFLVWSQLNLTYQLHGTTLLSSLETVNNKKKGGRRFLCWG